MWIEEKIEGKPHRRKRLDQEAISAKKILLKTAKHIAWLFVSFVTAFAFVSYFYTPQALLHDIAHWEVLSLSVFWLGAFTYLTYLDAGWLREQVCIYMCPYARFQSVMYDEDTLLVSYHPNLGEPRTSLKNTHEGGQCVDCKLCVQVCPTGIDIREGSQISCINCGLCIDACDDIMASLGRKTKLISFSSMNALAGKGVHLIRPKTIAYTIMLIILVSAFVFRLVIREPVEVNILRDRDVISYVTGKGLIANDYLLKITNKSQVVKSYKLKVNTEGFIVKEDLSLTAPPGEMLEKKLTLLSNDPVNGSQTIHLSLVDQETQSEISHMETRFIYFAEKR